MIPASQYDMVKPCEAQVSTSSWTALLWRSKGKNGNSAVQQLCAGLILSCSVKSRHEIVRREDLSTRQLGRRPATNSAKADGSDMAKGSRQGSGLL